MNSDLIRWDLLPNDITHVRFETMSVSESEKYGTICTRNDGLEVIKRPEDEREKKMDDKLETIK